MRARHVCQRSTRGEAVDFVFHGNHRRCGGGNASNGFYSENLRSSAKAVSHKPLSCPLSPVRNKKASGFKLAGL